MNGKIVLTAIATCTTFLGSLSISSPAKAHNFFGTKWGDSKFGTGATITYSFMPSGVGCSDYELYCQEDDKVIAVEEVLNGFEEEVRKAFHAWEDAANLNFIEVEDNGKDFNDPDAAGDIRIGALKLDGSLGTLANAFFPQPQYPSAAGDLLFDAEENWAINSLDGDPNTIDIFQVVSHEIGHAIGLRHSTVENSLMNEYYSESFRGPQADDIAAATTVYGSSGTDDNIPLDVALRLEADPNFYSDLKPKKKRVPEPTTVSSLLGLGLLGLILKRR